MFAPRELLYMSSFVRCNAKHCNQYLRLLSSQVKQQPLVAEGPWQHYSEKISTGLLNKDPHQEKVIQQLQHIYQEVVAFERPALQNQTSFFSFFRKSQPQKIIAPRGLYIYGSVGGGKTMLMDLFYDTIPVSILSLFLMFYLPI